MEKLMAYTALTICNIPVYALIEKYVFKDWEILGYAVVALGIDIACRILADFMRNNVNENVFKEIILKISVVATGLILTHVLSGVVTRSNMQDAIKYFQLFCYTSIFVYLTISWSESVYFLSKGKFPPLFIRKRLKNFNDTGKFNTDTNEQA